MLSLPDGITTCLLDLDGNAQSLREHAADVVVRDPSEPVEAQA